MTDERETRLPQWAQSKLNMLRVRIKELERQADVAATLSPSNSRNNVWLQGVRERNGLAEWYPSQWHAARFYVNDDEYSWIEVRRRSSNPYVEVVANNMILSMPASGNVIHVAPIDDYIFDMPGHVRMGVDALGRRLQRLVPRADR